MYEGSSNNHKLCAQVDELQSKISLVSLPTSYNQVIGKEFLQERWWRKSIIAIIQQERLHYVNQLPTRTTWSLYQAYGHEGIQLSMS